MANLIGQAISTPPYLQFCPLLPPRRRSKRCGGQSSVPNLPPAHPSASLAPFCNATRLPYRLPFGCSILVGADLHLDDEAHRGNVGAVRRSPMVCLGQLAGVSKVVRDPTHAMPRMGFAHLRH